MPSNSIGAFVSGGLLLSIVGVLSWSSGTLEAQRSAPAAVAQERAPDGPDTAGDWTMWSSGRYRITPGDVIQVVFPYVPEFDQTLTVQPDGYVSLRNIPDQFAQGRTVPEFQHALTEAYASVLRDPTVNIVLKEFERPYFIAAGEVAHPGRFELRGATTLTQALAYAGGLTKSAKSSQIVLFRRFTTELLEVKTIDVKSMLRRRDLSEDVTLRPGDTVFVPQSVIAKIAPFIPRPSLGLYLDPLAWPR